VNTEWCDRYGEWALVTGASSGLGAEFVRQLAEKKMNIILLARREELMNILAEEVHSRFGVDTLVISQDLTQLTNPDKLLEKIGDREVGLLVNNAGYGMIGNFHTRNGNRQSQMVYLNCVVPVQLTQVFLPAMVERGKGGLIFLASTAGYQATPYFSAYGASKGFNLLLGEALWGEYHNRGVDVLALSPGFTETGFQKVAGTKSTKSVSVAGPVEVVSLALESLGKAPSVIHGKRNRFMAFSQRFTPRKLVIKVTGALMKRMRVPKGDL